MTPTAVYSDGGCIERNPSPIGGTWAWAHVHGETLVASGSGVVRVTTELPQVSNNVAEYAALARCLKALPDGWSGPVYCDSEITLGRFFDGWRNTGIPTAWVLTVHRQILPRLGALEPVLLGGHPTRAELAAGVRRDGKPVSAWNVWCDAECGKRAREVKGGERW